MSALMLLLFMAEIAIPPGVAVWLLYAPLCLLGLWMGGRRVVLGFGIVATILMVIGSFPGPDGIWLGWIVFNRILGCATLWGAIVAGLAVSKQSNERRAAIEQLESEAAQRIKAEQSLRESEERFRAVFEHAGIGISITDRSGRFEHCNPAYCRLLGYTVDELRNMTFEKLVHPDDRAENVALDQHLKATLLPYFEIENRYVRKEGEVVWVRKFISSLNGSSEEPSHYVALVTDITAHRRLEEAQRNAERRKDEFLAVLGHELRNPLVPIRNAAELLIYSPKHDWNNVHWAADTISRQLDHLTRLVDDLLDVARISRGDYALKRGLVDLRSVIDQAVAETQPLIEARNHQLTVGFPEFLPTLDGDAARLTQVISNLLANAAKYTPDSGHIELAITLSDETVSISVKDNGIGISAELLPQMFNLFTRTVNSLERSEEGLGLGLHLVRRLIELHGGNVQARSEGVDQGSEFVVQLPLSSNSVVSEQQANVHELPSDKLRILVVDDLKDIRASTAYLLSVLGHQVQTAVDGPSALAIAPEFNPQLILLDIGLPKMDGYEVVKRLRVQPGSEHVRIIAWSGYGASDDRSRALQAGFDDYVTKPANLTTLLALLAQVPATKTPEAPVPSL